MEVSRVISAAFCAPDAPKIPAPEKAKDLIEELKQMIDDLQGPIEAQQPQDSTIAADQVANGELECGETAGAATGATQVCPDASQRVVTSADLRISPDVDPYGAHDPQWIRGGLQAIGPIADAVSTLSPLPGRDRIIELLVQLFDALAPVLLETPVVEEKRGKTVSLLRTYLGYRDFADQLLARWTEADEALLEGSSSCSEQQACPVEISGKVQFDASSRNTASTNGSGE
jgi:hypothetical protein